MLLVESFLQKQSDTRLVKLCSKDCSLFSASPGPPTRGVESRSSPQAPRVGSSAPTLPGTRRVPGESFTSHSALAYCNLFYPQQRWSLELHFCNADENRRVVVCAVND